MRHQGADYLVVAMKWSNVHGAKGVGCGVTFDGPTSDGRSPQNETGCSREQLTAIGAV